MSDSYNDARREIEQLSAARQTAIRKETGLLAQQRDVITRNRKEADNLRAELMRLAAMIAKVSAANRELEVQARKNDLIMGSEYPGDFKGNVIGEWVRLNEDGTGTVSYNEKEYNTIPLKQYSTIQGKKVQMIYEKGRYYSQM